ncbi:MAG: C45 family autoproteolytic acyltransferase/hydrolase [Bacteriovoracaceae bacterium]|nr:C45 family autoproteolytic acyltransferase/hydrolase [Bacteriovoracaceae bacterium]
MTSIFKNKIFLVFYFLFSSLPLYAEVICHHVAQKNQSILKECVIETNLTNPRQPRKIYLLELQGKNAYQTSYDHGFLLASQIEEGSLNEALVNIENLKKSLSPYASAAADGAINCISKHLDHGLSNDFKSAVQGMYDGYKAKLGEKAKFTFEQFQFANNSIEIGNILYGLVHKAASSKVNIIFRMLNDCGRSITRKVAKEFKNKLVEKGILKEKFACTGLITPNNPATGEEFIHGRNLEQTSMMNSWNIHPVIFVIKETEGHKQPYVGFGTAGLIFPGGISGMNESGLTVSLHQLNTVHYDYKLHKGKADLAPYVQQRILRDATTIEEAIKIVENTEHLSAWIIILGDAKTNRAVSIEINPHGVIVARSAQDAPLGQTNHYVSPQLFKYHFQSRYSNYLESTMRLKVVTDMANHATSAKDPQWFINTLADHYDGYDKVDRLYGRSVARVSNIMSSIVAPKSKQVWMTIADSKSPIHGTYLGLNVDFSRNEFSLIPETPLRRATNISEEMFNAAEFYVKAHIANANGKKEEALANLVSASKITRDPHAWYSKGKYELYLEKYADAAQSWKVVLEDENIDPFTRARAYFYLAFAKYKLCVGGCTANFSTNESTLDGLNYAEKIFNAILTGDVSLTSDNVPKANSHIVGDQDIEDYLKNLQRLKRNKMKRFKISKPDLGSID